MQSFIRRLLDTLWPSLAWTLMIFILLTLGSNSFKPASFLIEGLPNIDKLIHAILFGGLVYLWWHYLSVKTSRLSSTNLLIMLFILASGYGIGMEYYQKYFTSRDFEVGDIYADTAGAAISAFICRYIKKISPYGNRGRNQN